MTTMTTTIPASSEMAMHSQAAEAGPKVSKVNSFSHPGNILDKRVSSTFSPYSSPISPEWETVVKENMSAIKNLGKTLKERERPSIQEQVQLLLKKMDLYHFSEATATQIAAWRTEHLHSLLSESEDKAFAIALLVIKIIHPVICELSVQLDALDVSKEQELDALDQEQKDLEDLDQDWQGILEQMGIPDVTGFLKECAMVLIDVKLMHEASQWRDTINLIIGKRAEAAYIKTSSKIASVQKDLEKNLSAVGKEHEEQKAFLIADMQKQTHALLYSALSTQGTATELANRIDTN